MWYFPLPVVQNDHTIYYSCSSWLGSWSILVTQHSLCQLLRFLLFIHSSSCNLETFCSTMNITACFIKEDVFILSGCCTADKLSSVLMAAGDGDGATWHHDISFLDDWMPFLYIIIYIQYICTSSIIPAVIKCKLLWASVKLIHFNEYRKCLTNEKAR